MASFITGPKPGDAISSFPREEILDHSDSLIIYQNYRLTSGSQAFAAPDTTRKVERQRCSMVTKNGSRCKRLALPGSDRCWQHKK